MNTCKTCTTFPIVLDVMYFSITDLFMGTIYPDNTYRRANEYNKGLHTEECPKGGCRKKRNFSFEYALIASS